ncbi:MAG: cell division protein ZapA [Xanthomonadales bacterium]|nr:cell division protein ZapA [Xanthomonadales bacterium]
MSDGKRPVSVKILDREYLVSCTQEERAALLQAAAHVDAKMREVRGQSKVLGLERVAVLAALNIAHESIGTRQQLDEVSQSLASELRTLNLKLERQQA